MCELVGRLGGFRYFFSRDGSGGETCGLIFNLGYLPSAPIILPERDAAALLAARISYGGEILLDTVGLYGSDSVRSIVARPSIKFGLPSFCHPIFYLNEEEPCKRKPGYAD